MDNNKNNIKTCGKPLKTIGVKVDIDTYNNLIQYTKVNQLSLSDFLRGILLPHFSKKLGLTKDMAPKTDKEGVENE